MAGKLTVEEVFGIRTRPVRSYVARVQVDGAFEAALKTDHHIVIYGSSKQGKTALRQKHLDEDADCAVVRPGPRTNIEDIYQPLLRNAGIGIETFLVTREDRETSATVKTGFKAVIPWIGGTDAALEGGKKSSDQKEFRTEFVGFNFAEAQSTSELLKKASFKKYVVVENFHYLQQEVQKQLAFDLKTFHELGIRFIILGIWRESNRLLLFNGDLQDRVVEIPVEPWTGEDLKRVAATGCAALNISITPEVVETLIQNAYGNVGMFQEFLRTYCILSGVKEVQDEHRTLADMAAVDETFAAKLRDQQNTFVQSLIGIAARSRTRTDAPDPLILPYYLVKVLLRADIEQLQAGIEKKALLQLLRQVHHREDKSTIRMGDITNLLTNLPSMQDELQPPLLYFDGNSRRLRVVDTRQFFVLARINRSETEDEIPNPRDEM